MEQEIIDRGKNYFQNQWLCAESVLLALSEAAGIKSEFIPKIATGFCAGLARNNEICGAVTGGILAINLMSGRDNPEDSVENNFKMIEKFQKVFKTNFQSTNCFELTNCDFTKPEGFIKFETDNVKDKCTKMVGESIRIVLDIFNEFGVEPFIKKP